MISQTAFFLPVVPVFYGSRLPVVGQFRHPRGFFRHNLLFDRTGIDLSEHGFPSLLLREAENFTRCITVSKNNYLCFQRLRFQLFSFQRVSVSAQPIARLSLKPIVPRDDLVPVAQSARTRQKLKSHQRSVESGNARTGQFKMKPTPER